MQFIPIAEDEGRIGPITARLMRKVCQQLGEWKRAHLECEVSNNVSPHQIVDTDYPASVKAILVETGIASDRVRLEVTEGAMINNPGVAAGVMRDLRELGVQVYLDDFGTGFSSLSYLHRFPIDVVKIDRSFVNSIETDSRQTALIAGIVSIARAFRMKVVGEGVETEGQMARLRELGCDMAQGYLIARPLTADQARVLLVERRRNADSITKIATAQQMDGPKPSTATDAG
jgi:EAL domain-containing protein (putative c-di-GMP-specific phosphodiesterase class I)